MCFVDGAKWGNAVADGRWTMVSTMPSLLLLARQPAETKSHESIAAQAR